MELIRRILVATLLVVGMIGGAVGGGAYLWYHQSVADLRPHTIDVREGSKALDAPLPNHAAIALVLGYDHRAGEGNSPSRSDTLMLIRADPTTDSISLLSFPRDLIVPIYCDKPYPVGHDRINSAYARCGSKGTLETVKHLTGLPVNYLVTVNFHGFKEIVNRLGGVWMDIDRRYYNKNVGTSATDYANIDLQPGYQKLSGQQALDFVRFRHTDSDLYRLARQQEFVRAFKQQVKQSLSVSAVISLVNIVTKNVEVGEGGGRQLQGNTVMGYARFAAGLPGGHFFQDRLNNVSGYAELSASNADIQQAVTAFQQPDVGASKAANAAAFGRKVKSKAPLPASISVTVLNGNGIAGAAANAAYLLAQRGFKVLDPPNGLSPNAPTQDYFHTKIYYDAAQPKAKASAVVLQQLMQPADIARLPRSPALLALDPGAKLMVVLGTTFHGQVAAVPSRPRITHQAAQVRFDASVGSSLLDPYAKRVPFPLMNPTVLERGSVPDTLGPDKPARVYRIDPKHKAVRLVFRTGGNQYWGVEETDWSDAPVLSDKSFRSDLGGREMELHYSGQRLHMVVLRTPKATYWVVNTLLDSLSNETMLAIAKGLRLLTPPK